jgi:hypothetical protein
MDQHDATRGAHPSDPAEGAAPDEDANSPARQRETIQADPAGGQPGGCQQPGDSPENGK